MKNPKKKYIFDVKDKKIEGYLVRVVHGVNGKRVTITNKMFCIADYSSKKIALKAAMAHRDKIVNASVDFGHNQERLGNKGISHKVINSRNKTGVVGVQFKDLDYFHGYVAAWQQNGVTKTRSFSTRHYTNKKAFKLAKAYREKMVETHYRR